MVVIHLTAMLNTTNSTDANLFEIFYIYKQINSVILQKEKLVWEQ